MAKLMSQKLLDVEYEQRRRRNPLYSMRAFARDLGMPRTTVIDVLAGSRKLSKMNVEKVAMRLKLEKQELAQLENERRRTWPQLRSELNRKTLADVDFSQICSWHYYAILNLSRLADNLASSTWIADRLGISKAEAMRSLKTLKRLHMIEVIGRKMKRISSPLQTTQDVPSRFVRDLHRQFLDLAEQSIDNVDLSLRDLATVTVAIDRQKLPQVKKLLLELRRKVVSFLESDTPDCVYILGTTLFPTRNYRKPG